ncbi:uncharacterized protein LOC129942817 [Eupeodes corollae]|uniref:uncharacterized protein LOC129942817 n=1 Tax=Eupeodes corollae TaxID=290404 RepID=UPI00249086A1|nr:uncharacterized protein LOC129942817 [Eupeodes corollae]
MCWCLRVYWTVLHNLFVRFLENLTNAYYSGFCCVKKRKPIGETKDNDDLSPNFDDYIIVSDLDLEYYVIPTKKIETEAYYRTVDRKAAEELLTCHEDGACLVRPYKEQDISIKYVVTVYAQQNYFHLYIRKILGTEMYGIGQAKPCEKLFNAPSDIIDYYRLNPLLCTNKKISISLKLIPIS